MKPQPLAHWGLNTSRLVFGCMGLGGDWTNGPITKEHVHQAEQVTEAALEAGISMFDHADIYRSGKAELVFGQMLKARPSLRDNMIIQSKCGIRFADGDVPGRYDFSKDYILNSVEGILKRLGIETLDILLLHRPDPLMEPDEVAEVIETLYTSGKVKRFGVSNMSAGQIRFLQQASSQPFIVNQLEISLAHLHFLDQGFISIRKLEPASILLMVCWSIAIQSTFNYRLGVRWPRVYFQDSPLTERRKLFVKQQR